jgi:hypothetical protein
MKIRFKGYSTWKHIKDELGMFEFYVLPSATVFYDSTYDIDEYPTEIKIAWLFWELCIYLKK